MQPPHVRPEFDLQSHSVHSDGALPAADVVAHAAVAGLKTMALTEHDTVDGVCEARAREAAGQPLGRPHLADALLSHRANAGRLRDEGIAGKNELFPPYLVPGAIAYVARSRPTVEEAIDVIHAAGGLAVWAHPFWDIDDAETVLAGVEVFYPTHDEAQTRLLYETCTSKGLLTTGSADFHGPDHGRFSVFGGFELYGLEPVLGPLA